MSRGQGPEISGTPVLVEFFDAPEAADDIFPAPDVFWMCDR
jgi:hypothetical protein